MSGRGAQRRRKSRLARRAETRTLRTQPAALFTPTHRCPTCDALEADPGPVICFMTPDGSDREAVVFCSRCLLRRLRELGMPEMRLLPPAEFDALDVEYRERRAAFAREAFGQVDEPEPATPTTEEPQ